MKFTLSWLKDHLETDASLEEITDKLSMIGLEVEGVEDRAKELAPFTVAYVKEARQQHPTRTALRVCIVDTGSRRSAGGLRRAQRAHRHDRRLRAGGQLHPRHRHGAEARRDSRRGLQRHAGAPSARWALSDEHEGIIELETDAPPSARPSPRCWASAIRSSRSPSRRTAATAWACAASPATWRRRVWAASRSWDEPKIPGSFESPIKWRRDLAGEDGAALPLCGRALLPGCQERPLAQVDAGPPARHRPPPHFGAGRHHQLRDLRPEPAAARLRRRQGEGRRHHAPGPRRARKSSRWTAKTTSLTRRWW